MLSHVNLAHDDFKSVDNEHVLLNGDIFKELEDRLLRVPLVTNRMLLMVHTS